MACVRKWCTAPTSALVRLIFRFSGGVLAYTNVFSWSGHIIEIQADPLEHPVRRAGPILAAPRFDDVEPGALAAPPSPAATDDTSASVSAFLVLPIQSVTVLAAADDQLFM